MIISRYNPSDFLSILKKLAEGTPETILQFPLEYYLGEGFIFLYKTVMSKTYKTLVTVDEEDNVRFDNKKRTVEEFIIDLQTNFNAKELLEPIDYIDILLAHNHNQHEHAGVGFDDIFDRIGQSK